MICNKCGNEIAANAKFCAKCGSAVSTVMQSDVCGRCGTPYKPGAMFCAVCGNSKNTAGTTQNFSGVTTISKNNNAPVAKIITYIVGLLLTLAGAVLMWTGSFFVYDDTGISMCDILYDFDLALDKLYDADRHFSFSYSMIFLIVMLAFALLTVVAIVFMALSIKNIAAGKYNSSLTKIIISAILEAINFAALTAVSICMVNVIDSEFDKVADDTSIGIYPIVCLVAVVALIVSVIVVKVKKKEQR